MIKKAVYTHYSLPYGSDIRNSTHWLFQYLEFIILAYSSAKSKKFFGNTVLVTDEYGKKLIIDDLKIPFDEVIVELDGCEKKPRFWASGKIYGYTKAIKSFDGGLVHFDNDAGFHIPPPEFTSELTVQHIHHEYGNRFGEIFKGLVERIVNETPNEFPYDIYHEAVKGDLKGCNCGMIAFCDEEVWSEFSRYTWALQESEFFDKIENEAIQPMYRHFNYWNVVVEEILLYAIFKRLKKKEPEKLFDFNGFDFPKDIPNPTKYFHIWGSKKNRDFLKVREQIALNYLDKNLTDRILKYFKRK